MSGARVAPSVPYAAARRRLRDLVAQHPGELHTPVPATPGWSVHDAVAHLTGVCEDLPAGKVPGSGPTPEWTAGHVERGRGVPVDELFGRWETAAPAAEAIMDRANVWPPVLDAGAHELDVRAALGDRSGRDSDLVVLGARLLLSGLTVPAPLVVVLEDREVNARLTDGADPDATPVTLRTTAFEAFRWRLGRRSRAQLRAMDWDGDPEPFLPYLCVFGPSEADIIE